MQITLQKLTCALRSLFVSQAMAARVPDKRAITYVDQKVRGSQTPLCGLKLEVSGLRRLHSLPTHSSWLPIPSTTHGHCKRARNSVPTHRLPAMATQAREASHVTFVEVQTYSRRIASYLQRDVGLRPGERVVLMFPPGQEFILAFLG